MVLWEGNVEMTRRAVNAFHCKERVDKSLFLYSEREF